jgi:uncharacterized protein with PQ loop repeat
MASWAVYKYLTIVLDDDRLVGKLCMCTSIVIYLYFSYIIYRVIKEKNYLLIHLYQITIYFVSCLVWLFYGIIAKDLYLVCPYAMGAVISLLQIVIYINFWKKYPAIEEKDLITSIGIEFVISLQLSHSPHGCIVGPFLQFKDFAKILAVEVLPVPLGPVKR